MRRRKRFGCTGSSSALRRRSTSPMWGADRPWIVRFLWRSLLMPRLSLPFTRLRAVHKRQLSVNLAALLVALLVGAAASALEATGIANTPLEALDDATHDLLLRSQPAESIPASVGI